MGGGGANSLDSPKIEGNSDFESDKKDTIQAEELTYEKRSYEDYLTDFDIPTSLVEIDKTTVTGNGTLSNPYVINSTQDFVFFSKVGMSSKFFKLNCDIIYNDEVFDENGTPSGGDGVYYEWKPIVVCREMVLDGNGFSLSGFYFNDETITTEAGIFKTYTIEKIENLKMNNIFIRGNQWVTSLCSNINKVENVVFESGFVQAIGKSVGGIALNVYKHIKNCKNYASVSSDDNYVGGICGSTNGQNCLVENCENYGSVYAYGNAGGIVGRLIYNSKVLNSNNYGHIVVKYYHGAGIVGQANKGTIESSDNYGKIETLTKYSISGICGMTYGSMSILNCKNYGQRIEEGAYDEANKSQILGYVQIEGKETIVITIKGCGAYSSCEGSILGSIHQATNYRPLLVVNIENCHIKCSENNNDIMYLFMYLRYNIVELNIKNNIVEIECDTFHYSLVREKWDNYAVNINIENLVINAKVKNQITSTMKNRLIIPKGSYHSTTYLNIKNAIFNFNVDGREEGIYYGEDFDDYFINWKTGKMGIKNVSGSGLFQTRVTEEMLISRGYEKRDV